MLHMLFSFCCDQCPICCEKVYVLYIDPTYLISSLQIHDIKFDDICCLMSTIQSLLCVLRRDEHHYY